MMATIVESFTKTIIRDDVPPDVYFGDAEPDAMIVLETVIVQSTGPDGITSQRPVYFVWTDMEFK